MFKRQDDTLVKKALRGDERAWIALIERYEKAIYNYGIRMAGSHADAADLMQDIFLSVYKSLDSYRGGNEGSFKCWLFRIAHFRCVEFYRRKRPHDGLDDVPEQACEGTTPEQGVLNANEFGDLHVAMQTLPMNQKAVVELKFFGQFTFDEIASQLGISSNTVKSRLYSALDKLKYALEDNYADYQ
ncbi:sigma-70 family RNA polymerase sigma factor [Alteromonas sediminis]|uniref:Sigma-70 family RNA polymerase sigma factor n=1 Tax=Alteromonas sediminis TaxID=2259342 RepID=A0A3N5YMN8_9ALTE|nr:sigma-70 family RNA polymerase sigma factor [Alteromonas sediminis]RPJ66721.1 sigma-70 family RNA polymerase sigma factor [Alteromonas sediminis]